jgi:exopolysaccharide biosynthesis predicted pyruvyltransferase EpsI
VRRPPREKVGTFIYGGGGAWCKNWNNSRFVNAASMQAQKVIVLPSTYAIRSPLFTMEHIHFFCRDYIESQVYCPRAVYHKDMAFHIQSELHPITGTGVGYFMRTDKERSRLFDIPKNNKDISLLGKTYSDTAPFINAINRVREVHTDRLHVAIVACMLHKKVYFYEGNYFKNSAVFHSCMRGVFDVTFRKHDRC